MLNFINEMKVNCSVLTDPTAKSHNTTNSANTSKKELFVTSI